MSSDPDVKVRVRRSILNRFKNVRIVCSCARHDDVIATLIDVFDEVVKGRRGAEDVVATARRLRVNSEKWERLTTSPATGV